MSDVNKADILHALEPIWTTKPETASRVKQRIRAVMDWAAARNYRHGHDPHLWDQVAKALPKTKDVKKPQHFAECPYPAVYEVLQAVKATGASEAVKLAFEYIVLTAALWRGTRSTVVRDRFPQQALDHSCRTNESRPGAPCAAFSARHRDLGSQAACGQ